MRSHAQYVFRVAGDDLRTSHTWLETERCTLDRRRSAFRRNIAKDFGDVDCILRTLLGAPVRLVDLFLHDSSFERPVRKCIHRVQIHVVVGEKLFELVALPAIADQSLGGFRCQPQRHAERLVGRDACLHLWDIGRQACPYLIPVIAWMDQGRICQVAEAFAEIHILFLSMNAG